MLIMIKISLLSVNLSTLIQMSIKRKDRHKQEIRYAFLQAGTQLILEHGYEKLTVADIARQANYGRSTFYLYFKDKEDLFWGLLQHHMQVLDEQIFEATKEEPSPKKEWIAWRMIFADIDKQRSVFLNLDRELSVRLWQKQKDFLVNGFEQQLREGQFSLMIAVPPELAARFVVGALIGLLDYYLLHASHYSPEEMADTMFRLVLRQSAPPK